MSTAQRRPKRATFRCRRCKRDFGYGYKCRECGVDRERTVRRRPGRHKIGGKRGKNSGRVKQHGKKGG